MNIVERGRVLLAGGHLPIGSKGDGGPGSLVHQFFLPYVVRQPATIYPNASGQHQCGDRRRICILRVLKIDTELGGRGEEGIGDEIGERFLLLAPLDHLLAVQHLLWRYPIVDGAVDKGGNEQGGQRRAEQSGETVLSHLRLRRLDEGELDVRLELLPDQRPVDQAFQGSFVVVKQRVVGWSTPGF